MNDLLGTLSHTPLPTILVVAGIVFWILAVAGSLAGKITVEPGKQKAAGLVGTAFILLGLILFFVPGPVDQTAQTSGSPTPTSAQTKGSLTRTEATEHSPVQTPGSLHEINTVLPIRPDQASARPGPGVNCKGTPDEVEICASPTLSALDLQLYGVYQALMKQSDKNQQIKLAHEESAWVKQRGECQSDELCLTAKYKLRIEQLQSAR